jgi:glycosyltransferase involved in cell wall biosynthesis
MKIACVTTSQIPSSTANSIQVMKVCQALAQLGHEVKLWTPGTLQTPWKDLAVHYGLNKPFDVEWVRSVPRLKRYDFAYKAWLRVRKWQPHLVYTWLPQTGVLALASGFPVVLELHDRPSGKVGPRLLHWMVLARGHKRFSIITHALYTVLQSEFNLRFSPDSVVIAPNGVDLERYQHSLTPEAARRELGLPEQFTVVYSGHFYPGRGMGLLLELARRFPGVQFLWVGGRPEAVAYWKSQIAEAGLGNILLTGFVENQRLPLYQAAGEVLLMPYEKSVSGSSGGNSADICSPMKMFEYLASGRALITSDLPVLHEVLNEEIAVFCPPEDVEAWDRALRYLIQHPEECRRRGEMAWAHATRYTWVAREQKILGDWLQTALTGGLREA